MSDGWEKYLVMLDDREFNVEYHEETQRIRVNGNDYTPITSETASDSGNNYSVEVGAYRYNIYQTPESLLLNGRETTFMHLPAFDRVQRKHVDLETKGELYAPLPSTVVEILCNKGDLIQKGAPIIVVEAMKMRNNIVSPVDGYVDGVYVSIGQTVESDTLLANVSAKPMRSTDKT